MMKSTKKTEVGSKVRLTLTISQKNPNFLKDEKDALLLESSMGLLADMEFA